MNDTYTKQEMLDELRRILHELADGLADGYTWEEQAPCIEDAKEWYDIVKHSDAKRFHFEENHMCANDFIVVQEEGE